jgi:class 3 adenylate cyclase
MWRALDLRFDSVELEQRFREYETGHRLVNVRMAIMIVTVIIILFARFDFEYGGSRWHITFLVRMFGPVAVLLTWLAVTFSPSYRRNTRLYDFLFGTASMSLTIFLSFAIGHFFDVPFADWSFPFLANCMMIVFYTGLLLVVSSAHFALCSVVLFAGFELCLVWLTSSQSAIAEINQNFIACLIITFTANRGLERLRRTVFTRNLALTTERERSDKLLYDLVPEPVAHRLKSGEQVADEHRDLAVVFIDIAGFTEFSATHPIEVMLRMLKAVFAVIDDCAAAHRIEKVKTIGDGDMAVSHAGNPPGNGTGHVDNAAKFCFDLLHASRKVFADTGAPLGVRIGLHVGPAFGGVFGVSRPFYDYWGTTINMAARLERKSESGRVAVSSAVRTLLAAKYDFIDGGEVALKGIGPTRIWFMEQGTHGVGKKLEAVRGSSLQASQDGAPSGSVSAGQTGPS